MRKYAIEELVKVNNGCYAIIAAYRPNNRYQIHYLQFNMAVYGNFCEEELFKTSELEKLIYQ